MKDSSTAGRALASASAAALLAAAVPAGANTVTSVTLQNTTQTVTSSSPEGFTTDYFLADPGTITVSVSDKLFPAALTMLQFSLFSGAGGSSTLLAGGLNALNSSPNATVPQVYTWQFQVAAGTYSTVFQAAAAPGAVQFPGLAPFADGMYADIVTYSANTVPLTPARGVMVVTLIALGTLLYVDRRRGLALQREAA